MLFFRKGALTGSVITGTGFASFRGQQGQQSNLTVFTFNNTDIGTPTDNRVVVISTLGVRSTVTARTLSSVTIGGNTASILKTGTIDSTAGYTLGLVYLGCPVSVGGTAAVVVTLSGAASECYIQVYAVYPNATVPNDSAINMPASGNTSLSLAVQNNGVAILGSYGVSGTSSSGSVGAITLTGVAADADATLSTGVRASPGHSSNLSAQTLGLTSSSSSLLNMAVAATWS